MRIPKGEEDVFGCDPKEQFRERAVQFQCLWQRSRIQVEERQDVFAVEVLPCIIPSEGCTVCHQYASNGEAAEKHQDDTQPKGNSPGLPRSFSNCCCLRCHRG